jgi:hypothetical protein
LLCRASAASIALALHHVDLVLQLADAQFDGVNLDVSSRHGMAADFDDDQRTISGAERLSTSNFCLRSHSSCNM